MLLESKPMQHMKHKMGDETRKEEKIDMALLIAAKHPKKIMIHVGITRILMRGHKKYKSVKHEKSKS